MNKFKLLLPAVFLPILLALPTGVIFASPLDLFSASGSFWGKVDAGTAGETHGQFNFDQGIHFRAFPHVEAYFNVNGYQQTGESRTNWIAEGIRNNTLVKPFVFGLEYQEYYASNPSVNNLAVGYISVYKDWNLAKE